MQGRSGRVRPTWGRILVLIALVVLAAVVARSCQQSQIRVTKEQAIAIADRQIDFKPESTQIRLLRQGLNRKPFWFVSLSDPIGSATHPRGFTRIVIVEIDANSGSVEDVKRECESGRPGEEEEPGGQVHPEQGAAVGVVRLLILQHISCEPPGVFSEVMRERGVEPVAVELDENEPLPDWREFDAVLAMGGPMGANDDADHPWLRAEKELVREVVEDGRPFLGVCLGVQLLASALGAPVRTMDSPELGLLPVELTAEGREHPLFEGVEDPFPSLQWHGDTFDLPDGAVALASSPVATQAFQAGERAFGIQFHLEVTPEMAREWSEVPEYRAYLAEALDPERADAFLAELEQRAEELHPTARRLFGNWLKLAGDTA